MPPGSDALLAEDYACFLHEKIKTIHESFSLEDCLRVPFTFPNDFQGCHPLN